jgi:hypothetical protein
MKCRQAENRIHVVEYGNHGPLFHHDFHARRSMLNCVPDSWPSFFKITRVAPLSFFIAESIASHDFYEKLTELYIGPWSNRGIRHLTKGIRTQCIADKGLPPFGSN